MFVVKTNLTAGSRRDCCPVLGNSDGDTNVDSAVANYNAHNVQIFSGNGDGTFVPKNSYNVGNQPHFIVLADFDHDGKMDLATVNTSSGTVSVLLGNGDGTFQVASNYPVGTTPIMVAVGDVNGDGKASDLVVCNQDSDTVSLLLGNGQRHFCSGGEPGHGSVRPHAPVALGETEWRHQTWTSWFSTPVRIRSP